MFIALVPICAEQSCQLHDHSFRHSILVQVQCDEPLTESRRSDETGVGTAAGSRAFELAHFGQMTSADGRTVRWETLEQAKPFFLRILAQSFLRDCSDRNTKA